MGLDIALKALQSGFTVIATVRDQKRAAKAVEDIEEKGNKCLELDVTDAKACFEVFHRAEAIYDRIDVLVNNAGLSWLGAIEDFSWVLFHQKSP